MKVFSKGIGLLVALLVIVPAVFVAASDLQAATAQGGIVDVQVTILPKASSFRTSLKVTPAKKVVNQNQVLNFSIHYRSENQSAVPLTLQAKWDVGVLTEENTIEIDGLEYVVGSASEGYGGTPPVVDVNARTITWNILSLPKTGEQIVKFKLKTNDAYTGPSTVTFPVQAKVTSIAGVPVMTHDVVYQYAGKSLPQNEATLFSSGLAFTKVAVSSINDLSARVDVLMNQPEATVRLLYGTDPQALDSTALVTFMSPEFRFLVLNLQPKAVTYFRLTAETGEQTLHSDIFSFSTASAPSEAILQPWSLAIAQQQTMLRTGPVEIITPESLPVVVQQKEVLDVSLSIPDSQKLHLVEVIARPLKLDEPPKTRSSILSSSSVVLTSLGENAFTGKLTVPTQTGQYELVSLLADEFGNTAETKLQLIEVQKSLRVFDQLSGFPLVNAEVTLLHRNQATGEYEKTSNVSLVSANPMWSDTDGVVNVSRLPGEYQVQVRVAGYEVQKVEFEIDADGKMQFPEVGMKIDGNHYLGRFRYQLYQLSKSHFFSE